ncbi:hypothetical protein niasHS_008404 [Heterodera schachtii]|uniref:Uncharacterized protein n=1 Tax=Heterodera schachtii TaxID=97005 RepID=A0ABD2IUS5_HETSC
MALGQQMRGGLSSTKNWPCLLRLGPERDVKAKIFWLVKRCRAHEADIGPYLTRNPYFLLQSFDELKARLDYLQFHRFNRRQIAKLVVEYRYWLNTRREASMPGWAGCSVSSISLRRAAPGNFQGDRAGPIQAAKILIT